MFAAAISIIFSAVYMLNMIQKVFYGNTNALTAKCKRYNGMKKLILGAIVMIIFVVGVYPEPMLDLTKDTVDDDFDQNEFINI